MIQNVPSASSLYAEATMAWSMSVTFEDVEQNANGVEIDSFKGW